LRGFIAPERIITLYNCIDMAAVQDYLVDRRVARDFLQLPQNAFVFGTLGRLHPVKDQMTMLRALAAVQSRLPNAILIIMGEGDMEQPLKQAAHKLKITDRVIFKGFVPDGYRYVRAFDVFLLTSTREAFGRVLPEAMAANVPAIGTRTHGIPEVIGDAGILIMPGDDQALARAMLLFYQMPAEEMAQWGEKAYAHIANHFSYTCFKKTFFALPTVIAALQEDVF
jgi:glycosyltransferase involved in cell wall biosynthesis